MNYETKQKLFDILERLFWTLVQAAIGFLAAVQTDNIYIGLLCAGAASGLKSLLATKFGNGTASTLPSSVEPEYTPPQPKIEPIDEDVNESYNPDDVQPTLIEVDEGPEDFDPDHVR